MQALFIGQTYIDVTFLTDRLPTDDEKHVASDYAVSFGGNAVTAAFCCAKLSVVPDLLTSFADDWLGRMFWVWRRNTGFPSIPERSTHLRCRSSCRETGSAPSCAAAMMTILVRFQFSISLAVAPCTSMATNPMPPFTMLRLNAGTIRAALGTSFTALLSCTSRSDLGRALRLRAGSSYI
jgi:hypothetical protein